MSDGLKFQYSILAELRRVDEKLSRLQSESGRIPEEIGKLDRALGEKKQEYDKQKNDFDTAEKSLRKGESDLKEKEDKLHKAEGKMMEVKTNEEYKAAMKENESQKQDKGGLEETVINLLSKLDAQKGQLKDAETAYKTYEASIQEDRKRLESEQQKLVDQINNLTEKKNATTSQLDPDVSALYHRVAVRAKGMAVVSVENGMCLGCNMKIRPQLYNEVIGYKVLHRCPTCGRILILPPKETTGADTAS